MGNMNVKEKMIQQLEMRMAERKTDESGFDWRIMTDALINCLVHDCSWQIPVGLETEMDFTQDDEVQYDGDRQETRIRFDGMEVVTSGRAGDHFFRLQALRLQDGSMVYVAYTNSRKNREGEPGYAPLTAVVACQKILQDLLQDEGVDGLVLNPGTDDVFLDKADAGFLLRAAERQVTPRPMVNFRLKRGISYRVALNIPVEQESFANVENILRSLRDMKFEFLVCDVLRQKESSGGYTADFVQAIYGSQGGKLRVEISLKWETNRVTHRMLLYDEMLTEEAVAFFREVLLDDRIPERTRDFHMFFEEKAREGEEDEEE